MVITTTLLLATLPLAVPAPSAPAPAPAQAAGVSADGPEAIPLAERGRLLDPIMTSQERAQWQALATDEEREAFLREFWDRRDPTPGTQPNEVREIFFQRADRAARTLAQGSTPGWATDRGRVLLVYGLPALIEARSADGAPAPEIVWTYTGDPPVIGQVRFVSAPGGYAVAGTPALSNETFLASTSEEVRLMLAAAFGGVVQDREPAVAVAAPQDGEELPTETPADRVSPEVRIWMQLVLGGVARDDIPLRSAVRTFPASEGTYTALAFHIGTEGLTFAEPLQILEGQQGEQPPREGGVEAEAEAAGAGEAEGESGASEVGQENAPEQAPDIEELPEGPVAELEVFGAFLRGEAGHETTVHQFMIPVTLAESEVQDGESPLLSLGVTLVPGTYRLAWGVMEKGTERAVTRDITVKIPDFATAGLTITDPLVARPPHDVAQEEMSTQAVYRGIRLGNVLIDDDIDRTFDRNETIEVVTVVTGWTPDPNQPGRPRLEVLYRILEGDEDVSIARLQPQSLDFHVLGQQIPLSQVQRMEEGKDYRILIQVTDSVSGKMALRQVPISIRAGVGESEQ